MQSYENLFLLPKRLIRMFEVFKIKGISPISNDNERAVNLVTDLNSISVCRAWCMQMVASLEILLAKMLD